MIKQKDEKFNEKEIKQTNIIKRTKKLIEKKNLNKEFEFNGKKYKTERGLKIAKTVYYKNSLIDLKKQKHSFKVKQQINKLEAEQKIYLDQIKHDKEKVKQEKKNKLIKSKEINKELELLFDNKNIEDDSNNLIKQIKQDIKKYEEIRKSGKNIKKSNIIKLSEDYDTYKELKKKITIKNDLKKKIQGDLDNLTIVPEQPKEYFIGVLKKLKNTGNKYTIRYNYIAKNGRNSHIYYTLNDETFKKLIKTYETKIIQTVYIIGVSVSDYAEEVDIEKLINIEINKIIPDEEKRKYKLNEGQFFKYYHKIRNLDLTDLQIYNKEQDIDIENNCLIHSLIKSNLVESEKIQEIKLFCKTRDIPMLKIKEIAEKFNLYITIKKSNTDKEKTTKYGDKANPEIKIGLLDNHYFIIKEIPITSYSIKHYEEVKNIDKFNEIIKKRTDREGKYKYDKKRFINSFDVVNLLLENKVILLEEIDYSDEQILSTPYYNEITDIKYLDYTDNNLSLEYNIYKTKRDDDFINIYFDFETTTENKHKPYLCCYYSTNGINNTFYGEKSGQKLLYDLTNKFKNKNLRLIAHNAGYDFRFIYQYLARLEVIDRGKMILRAYGVFYYEKKKFIKIEIQDSYSLIPMKLSNFSKTFNIECKKEIIPYNLYTEENIKNRYIDFDTILKCCSIQVENNNIGKNITHKDINNFYDELINNAKEWKCIKPNNKIDIIEYSKNYCLMDCIVLKEGYETFKKWIHDITELNINNYISLPSLSNEYMKKREVFKDVYALSGTPQYFINKCMVGGRTMISNNKKIKLDNNNLNIQDFDAVSLYPSAMNRLEGYLKGKPKEIKKDDLNYLFLSKKDGYFIEILIKSIGVDRNFSLMSELNDDGIRIFKNDMVGKKIYVDKISLEDLIEFQKVEFDIIRGYYYDEGRNNNLKIVINELFNERIKRKQEGNQIQEVYKLLLNSAYGKTLIKPIDCQTKYIKSNDFNSYVERHYNYIKEIVKLNDYTYKIKEIKPIDNHYNNVSCGVEVLSMSKRIMNEVICNAEDLKIPIYYQDTDSIHIEQKNIPKLAEFYKNKYNRELIGKNMGQFHSDFDSKIIKKNIHASRSIFLGKKAYIDELKGLDENNNEVIDYHIRLKSVSNDAILHECEKRKINPYELFELLYNDETIEFDLGCDGKKCNFKFNKDLTIFNNDDFKRKINFK